MELRSQTKVSGSSAKPRATSVDRKLAGTNRIDQADNVNNMTCVNSPSSPTRIARGGKSPSRILPTEGGRFRATGLQRRSESAGGAGRSPEGDPPRRRGQTRESGDAGGRATPGREPVVVAAESGKHPRQPDEGRPEFTNINRDPVEQILRRLSPLLLLTAIGGLPIARSHHELRPSAGPLLKVDVYDCVQ